MARPEKVATVTEIRERLEEADAAVLTEYRGLTVTEIAELRAALRPAGTDLKIFKNTLARRAATEAGAADLVPMLEGPTAIAFVKGDAVLAAKALKAFAKTTEAFVVKGGLLGTRLITPAEVDALAEVAPREELLARLAGAFQAPLVKAAGLFQALPRNMAYGVKALIDQRVAAGETAPPAEAPAAEPAAEARQTEEAPAAESSETAEPSGEATEETAEPTGEEAPAPEADTEAPAAE
jgi:large subunit ribosomal protein L10